MMEKIFGIYCANRNAGAQQKAPVQEQRYPHNAETQTLAGGNCSIKSKGKGCLEKVDIVSLVAIHLTDLCSL
jgi:hypothetical protein